MLPMMLDCWYADLTRKWDELCVVFFLIITEGKEEERTTCVSDFLSDTNFSPLITSIVPGSGLLNLSIILWPEL